MSWIYLTKINKDGWDGFINLLGFTGVWENKANMDYFWEMAVPILNLCGN
jgi:hypothetical protein